MSITADNLQGVHRRIAAAVEAAQRDPASVRLIAVSKTFPAAAVRDALVAGQRLFGENYVQEALDKIAEIAGRPDVTPPTWHFIGPIQSNKTRAIASHFDWVHGVDRLRIAERLSAQRDPARGALNVLVEVNVDDEASKSGIAPADALALARAVTGLPNLAFRGLMTVPAARATFDEQREPFARLRRLANAFAAAGVPCDHLSMGMSADLEAAIAEGATMIRVGSAIFGAREKPGEAMP